MAGLEELFVEKEVRDPNYEGWKKLYETNPDAAEMNENHAEYLKRYTLEMSTSDAGEAGILGTEEANMEFVEADNGEEVIVDDRINLMAAAPDGQPFLSGDQSATTLFMGNGGFAMQGGVRNYLGETNTVSGVPIKWKSAPDHPETELAYITKKEKDLLLKKDLHNSLDGSPNKGPEGLMSLNGGGYGSENAGTGGNDGFGGGGGGGGGGTGPNVQAPPGVTTISAPVSTPDYDYRGPADLGVTTRTVNRVTAPPATTRIGGKTYDVTPETKSTRDRAEVKAQIMRTPPSTKKFEVIDPITKTTLTSDKKTKKGFGGFSLLDVVLFVGTSGIINPEVTKIAKAISNIKTGLTVSSLVADKTKKTGVKETAKNILTSIAKDQISKKTGFSIKTIDTTLDTIEKALDTKLGKSVVDRFNSLNKEKTTDPNKLFSDKVPTRSDNDNDNSNKVITPVVPELIEKEIVVEEPTSSLSNLATLRLIRDRQARRKSFFNANSGGLAGLFKVKKQ